MRAVDIPWMRPVADRLGEGIPAALLIYGIPGVGKGILANDLAQWVLCGNPTALGQPCDTCSECQLYRSGNHPDFRLITNDEGEIKKDSDGNAGDVKKQKQIISVNAIRDLAEFSGTKPHRGYAKVVVINPAENLNVSASNALLKILEEPPEFLHFILVAKHVESVIPTIRSRCSKQRVNAPTDQMATSWLASHFSDTPVSAETASLVLRLSANAPFKVHELLSDEQFVDARRFIVSTLTRQPIDIFALASFCEKIDVEHLRLIFYALTHDLLIAQAGGKSIFHDDLSEELNRIRESFSMIEIIRWNDIFTDYLKSAHHPLNRRLALEALFLQWPQKSRSARGHR